MRWKAFGVGTSLLLDMALRCDDCRSSDLSMYSPAPNQGASEASSQPEAAIAIERATSQPRYISSLTWIHISTPEASGNRDLDDAPWSDAPQPATSIKAAEENEEKKKADGVMVRTDEEKAIGNKEKAKAEEKKGKPNVMKAKYTRKDAWPRDGG